MTPFLQLPPPREAQQVDAFMRGRHHQRQRRLPVLFRLRLSFGRDRNYRRRTLLILALAADNTAADRPLLCQLLRETQRSYTLGLSWDIRDAVADRDMAADIRHYLAQKDSRFRSRTDYLAYFAAQRLPLHLETLRESLT